MWNYVFQIFMKRYWDDEYRCIPVFMMDLEGEMLADFRHTEEGFNSIILSSVQNLGSITLFLAIFRSYAIFNLRYYPKLKSFPHCHV